MSTIASCVMMTSIASLLLALVVIPNSVLSLRLVPIHNQQQQRVNVAKKSHRVTMTLSPTLSSSPSLVGGLSDGSYRGNNLSNTSSLSSSSSSISSLKSSTFLTHSSSVLLRQQQWQEDNDNFLPATSASNILLYNNIYHKSTWIEMGKGDGKKKRKKKSSAASTQPSASSSAAAATPQPLRVTSNSNISVRRQIRWAQMKKEYERNSGTSFRQTNVKRTKYRKSLDEEEIEQKTIERKKRGQEPDWDVILNNTSTSPLVIVDGYNIIHQWPRLKKWMNKGMLSKARETLVHDLEELRLIKGWRIECVFDGFGRDTRGPLGDGPGNTVTVTKSDKSTKKKVTDLGVRVVFSGVGASADAYIEERCFNAKQTTEGKISGSFIVASNDNVLRMSATNAGAICMSADRLVDELKASRKITAYRVEAAVARANGVAMRPDAMRGSSSSATTTTSFSTKGQFIIEDKRKKKKKTKENTTATGEKQNAELKDLIKGTKSIPSWAIVPNNTKPYP